MTSAALDSCLDAGVSGGQGSLATGREALRWRSAWSPEDKVRVWSALWEAEDPGDENTSWTVTVKVLFEHDRAWVIVRVGLLIRGFRMSQVRLGLEPLPLVSALVGALEAEEDGRPLLSEPWYADTNDSVGHPAGEASLAKDWERELEWHGATTSA